MKNSKNSENLPSTLQVIGVGLGRTGTRSLKVALERLGYSPCYHLLDVFLRPWIIPVWLRIGRGGELEWSKLFRHFRAGVDYPFTTHFPQVLDSLPDIKVILTVREPEGWYDSVRKTIYPLQALARKWLPGGSMVGQTTIWHQLFHERFEERDYAIWAYLQHIETVKKQVPSNRLLVLDVRDGWKPLCRFLDKPVPDEPFPHANRRYQIWFGAMLLILLLLGLFFTLLGTFYLVFF